LPVTGWRRAREHLKEMAAAFHALIPAAGIGSRFGEQVPKQYQRIGARTIIEHSVHALADSECVRTIFVVLAPSDTRFRCLGFGGVTDKVVTLYCGGPTRGASVFNGLMAIHDQADDDDWILVHDAARPCVSRAEIERLIGACAADEVGGILAAPLTDTLKRADADGRIVGTEPREHLWRALTPQMFRYRLLVEALHAAGPHAVTDEASAIERLGLKPLLVAGSTTNLKVTYASDLAIAEAILNDEKRRTACE
jgi:2-C-methyl-D-erythritol 4-phosphate cytidylyltransferase